MVDQRGLADTGPGNDCHDIRMLVRPCVIEKSDILFSTKDITSGNGQSGYGNLLWTWSCWPLANFDTRSGRGLLLQVLTTDPTWCLDSICDRRYRLQQLVRSLETPCRIFGKEFLKQNYDRLWNIFELLKR
jgi:hypothetical protein